MCRLLRIGRVLACGLLLSSSAKASDEVTLVISVDGGTDRTQALPAFDIRDSASIAGLETSFRSLAPDYVVGVSAVDASVYVRGLPATARFASNSTRLSFSVPALGIDLSFDGSTRAQSRDLLLHYLAAQGEFIYTQLQQNPARTQPADPIAGNPTSLMAVMGAQDFAIASASEGYGGAGGNGHFGIVSAGFSGERWQLGDMRRSSSKTPFGYTLALRDGYKLTLSGLLDRGEGDGGQSFTYGGGAALHMPISPGWTLIPAVRFGAGGSREDQGSAYLYSASLTSRTRWYDRSTGIEFGMSNQLTEYRSRTRDGGVYDVDYDLSNHAMRNGFDIAGPLHDTFLGRGARWRAWIIDTRFNGDPLYCERWQDFGISIGTRVQAGQFVYEKLELGLTYTRGENDVEGMNLNFGYRF